MIWGEEKRRRNIRVCSLVQQSAVAMFRPAALASCLWELKWKKNENDYDDKKSLRSFWLRSTFGDVEVEKVAVEDRLHDARHHGNPVLKVLAVIAVDPVDNVQSAVRAQGEQVVGCDRLGFARLGHHKQLRQNGYRLQIDGEGPKDFHHWKLVVDEQRQGRHRNQQKLNPVQGFNSVTKMLLV